MRAVLRPLVVLGVVAGFLGLNYQIVQADTSSSSSYQVTETFFGAGGELNACSGTYCSKQSLGELTVGETKGTAYGAQAGFNTTDIPVLEIDVDGGTFDLGLLDENTTAYGSTTLRMRTYLAHGYVVRLYGEPLHHADHTFDTPAVPTNAQPGTEQFGVNLRDNATPDVGADPVQIPDNTFSFGTYSTDYGAADYFKYTEGDVIAESDSSSGVTEYTLSFIANIERLTPAGKYEATLSAVGVSTF